jgi:hypothetical protein
LIVEKLPESIPDDGMIVDHQHLLSVFGYPYFVVDINR